MRPRWCCVNTECWDANDGLTMLFSGTIVLQWQSQWKGWEVCNSYRKKLFMLKKKHVYVAMIGVEWWDDVLTPGSKITTAAKELCAARRFDSYHYYKSKLLFLGDIVYAAGIGFQSQGNIFTYQQVEKKPPKMVLWRGHLTVFHKSIRAAAH